jgi:hypothetical protein
MLDRMHSLIASLRGRSASRGRNTISLQETGFQLLPVSQTAEAAKCFQWREITTAIAYKRDCVTVDLICMAIADELTAIEITEEDAGWEEFIRGAEISLPGSLPIDTWWPIVSQPPFSTSQTTVYRKQQLPG